jgi:predicted amidophosphoribosyltransferase
MGKASDWLREERRKVLGDWVAVCGRCGAGLRWFEQFESEVPDECPQCSGELLRRCKSCSAPFSSIAAVDCEECGEPLRDDELFGSRIRKDRRRRSPAPPGPSGSG